MDEKLIIPLPSSSSSSPGAASRNGHDVSASNNEPTPQHQSALPPPWINLKLSPELFRMVMEFICECGIGEREIRDHPVECCSTWCAATLVCRGWTVAAQRSLFLEVTIRSGKALRSLAESTAFGRSQTKELRLIDLPPQPEDGSPGTVQKSSAFNGDRDQECFEYILRYGYGLEKLSLEGFRDREGVRVWDKLLSMESLSDLKHLSIRHSKLWTHFYFTETPRFNLSSLELCYVEGYQDEWFGEYHRVSWLNMFRNSTINNLAIRPNSDGVPDTMGHSFTSLLHSVADSVHSLRLNAYHTDYEAITQTFSLFSHLTDLEIECAPQDLLQILTLLPSKLFSLFILDVPDIRLHWDDLFIPTLLTILDLPSMGRLKTLKISEYRRDEMTSLDNMWNSIERRGIKVMLVRRDSSRYGYAQPGYLKER